MAASVISRSCLWALCRALVAKSCCLLGQGGMVHMAVVELLQRGRIRCTMEGPCDVCMHGSGLKLLQHFES